MAEKKEKASFPFTKDGFTALSESAATSKKRIRLRDPKTPGLLCDATPAGGLKFWVYLRRNGRGLWAIIGDAKILTIDEARRKAGKITGAIEAGFDPEESRRKMRQEPTLRILFDEYINEHVKLARKTGTAMQADFERYVGNRASERGLDDLSKRLAKSITVADIRLLKKKLAETPYVANRTLQLLRAVFNFAIRTKSFDGSNPVTGIGLYPEKSRARFLSGDEVKRLLDEIWNEANIDTRDFILLGLLTGVRKAAVLSMRFSDIDWQAASLTVPAESSKNGEGQVIKLTADEIQLLQSRQKYLADQHVISDFVFPGTGVTGHLVDPKRSWSSLRNRANLRDVTIHDLRRSLAATMASRNVNVSLIKGAMNHKDMKTTINVYARTGKDAERDARQTAHTAWFGEGGLQAHREKSAGSNKNVRQR